MTDNDKQRVLIVGAGSMGLVSGYILTLANAEVTFLVRPHRAKDLDRPQILYNYDGNQLNEFKEYSYITDPSKIIGANYDFIIITLDGAALQSADGTLMVKAVGKACQGTNTKVIVGTILNEIKPWFVETSGLDSQKVVGGYFTIHIYPVTAETSSIHAGIDQTLVLKADQAYMDHLGDAYVLADDAPAAAESFAKLWNSSGVATCAIRPHLQVGLESNPIFAVFAACDVLGWPHFKDIDREGELWKLGVAAAKEIQELGVYGELGQQASKASTSDSFAGFLVDFEERMLPLNLMDFFRYHHGSKVKTQDRVQLVKCIALGEAEGKPMSQLKKLVARMEEFDGSRT